MKGGSPELRCSSVDAVNQGVQCSKFGAQLALRRSSAAGMSVHGELVELGWKAFVYVEQLTSFAVYRFPWKTCSSPALVISEGPIVRNCTLSLQTARDKH